MRLKNLAYFWTTLSFWLISQGAFGSGQQAKTIYVHFEYQDETAYGILKGDTIQVLDGHLFENPALTSTTIPLQDITLLPATIPSKIIAVGLNYHSHHGSSRGNNPRLFSKLTSALTTHEAPIWMFPDANNLHYEGELVVIIGKTAKNISPKDAPAYIFGVTAGNDVTERNWQSYDLQWLRGKGADSFAPVAPWLATGLNYNDLLVQTRVNGKTVQAESTKNLLFSVDEIVSYASQYFTLYPGDMIFTGTPGRTSAMDTGDIVEVEIEGVGILRNTVQKRP